MAKPIAANRRRLLEAAEKTTHRYGFGNTAIADIAKQAGIPLGNVYYYFKTKDEIAESIVNLRVSRFRKLLEEFDKTDSPKQRLCAFVNVKMKNREELARHGCPVGTLCSELRALGQGADSRLLAVHLLSATQGVSMLAHAFRDPGLIDMEATRLQEWIRSLEPINHPAAV